MSTATNSIISENPPKNKSSIGEPLSALDLERLHRESWIDRATAEAAGLRRVDSALGAEIVGRRNREDYAGIVFPYCLPGCTDIREYRLRRDCPPLDEHRREQGKYLSPPGRGNMVYFPPGCDPAWLDDPSIPIVITEGEKKLLALWRLAWYGISDAAEKPRFLPIALSGVWNFRGTIGKDYGPNGDRRDVRGVIADLDRIGWKSRVVAICFDASSETNSSVEAAKRVLAKELGARGATVKVATWEASRGKGIDNVLAAEGPESVLSILDGAEGDGQGSGLSPAEIAELICERDYFARDAGGLLYVYRDGCYRPDGAAHIRRRVKAVLAQREESSKWSSHKAQEVVEYISVDAPELWERPSRDRINVSNGLLDTKTRKLEAHSPDFLSPVQIPVRYDATAACPVWEKFVSEVFPEDSRGLAWEVPAWLMTPDTSIQKAILLIGEGGNGKSTFLSAVVAFLGKKNTSSLSLHKLEENKFSVARLVGKLANVCPDLPSHALSSTSVFKALTGGDTLDAERKFKDGFDFLPFARLLFSANHPPKSGDASSAFFDRWVVVPFDRGFRGTAAEISRHELDAALAAPAELSGVLNRALDALARLRESGRFTEGTSILRAMDEFRSATDPMAVWLDQNTVLEPESCVSCDELRQKCNRDRTAKGEPHLTMTAFGIALPKLRPTIRKAQRTVNGKVQLCYVGIALVGGQS
jgi:P4 family phage/plasmid primase-like protien